MAVFIQTLNGGNITVGSSGGGGGSSGHAETRFTLEGGTVETHNISGTLDRQWLIANGYFDEDEDSWLKTITQVDIGNTVTSIGQGAFVDNGALTSVTIPGSVTSIGDAAFNTCDNLAIVTIGNGVTSIGKYSFGAASNLTSVTIPDSVTSIGSAAFDECSGLTSVTFEEKDRATVQGMSNYPFGLNYANENGVTIHCSDGDLSVSFE